jgi:hypothetical protein
MSYAEKKVILDGFLIHFNGSRKTFLEFLIFTLFKRGLYSVKKMVFHQLFGFFWPSSKLPIHTGLISARTSEPNISSLGPFNLCKSQYTVKKGYRFYRPQAGCH